MCFERIFVPIAKDTGGQLDASREFSERSLSPLMQIESEVCGRVERLRIAVQSKATTNRVDRLWLWACTAAVLSNQRSHRERG